MEEGDPMGWMVQLCLLNASQQAKLRNCPMARSNEDFSDSSPEHSPPRGPTPPGIIDASSSETSGSLPKNVDDGVGVGAGAGAGARVRVNECGEKGENEREAIEENGTSKRRRLPASFTSKGKENENDVPNVIVEEVKKNGGLMGFLDVLKAVFEEADDESDEDEDFFEMIQRKGFKFDKPRWLP